MYTLDVDDVVSKGDVYYGVDNNGIEKGIVLKDFDDVVHIGLICNIYL